MPTVLSLYKTIMCYLCTYLTKRIQREASCMFEHIYILRVLSSGAHDQHQITS
jgi:hypothetical protein